jgi:glycerol-1-phosphate dehydrogenase [NAD(P)+]
VAVIYGEGVKELFNNTLEISFISSEIKVSYENTAKTNDLDDAFSSAKQLPSRTKAIVAIGGGKTIDYCKYIALITQLPIISVPTIVSNDGFCSPLSSMLVNGARKTVKTKIPDGVIVDTQILLNAPEMFLYSGIGDLFCKLTAIFDWKLSYRKTGEYVNDFAAVICKNAVETFLHYRDKNFSNTEYLGIIVSSLLMSGIAMEIAGSSRPASGSEHLISHAYDKFAKTPSIHGIQTGLASYPISYLQGDPFETVKRIILESGFADFMIKNPLDKSDFIKAVQHAPEIKENYYTILAERDSVDKIIDFIETDELMQRMLK